MDGCCPVCDAETIGRSSKEDGSVRFQHEDADGVRYTHFAHRCTVCSNIFSEDPYIDWYEGYTNDGGFICPSCGDAWDRFVGSGTNNFYCLIRNE